MVSENDIVYIRVKQSDSFNGPQGTSVIGNGFKSEKEIKDKIKEIHERNPGQYEYGILNSKGSMTIPEPPDKDYNQTEIDIINTLRDKSEQDYRVTNFYTYENTHSNIPCSIFRSNIRYIDGEVDFSLRLDTNLFDSVPLSTLDEESKSKVKSIFMDFVNGNAEYLGFKSSYASRGRRNPYVNVYGRIHRDTDKDKQIRKIAQKDYILDIYWSNKNITPIPVYYSKQNTDKTDENDVIYVLDYSSNNDSFESIDNSIMDNVQENIRDIEENSGLIVNWIGKVSYKHEHKQICIGVQYV